MTIIFEAPFDPYIVAPWTNKSEELVKLWDHSGNPNDLARVKILQNLWLQEYAEALNREIDEIRIPKWAIKYCLSQLQQSNHSLAEKLLEWINLNLENAVWFQEKFLNWKLQLVDDWLSVNWIVVLLEDEVKGDWSKLFDLDEVNEYVKNPDKMTVRNWAFILNILPWDDKNKFSFLRNVLWLKESQYWAVTGYTNMAWCLELWEDKLINTCSLRGDHALRCVKRQWCSNNWWVTFG